MLRHCFLLAPRAFRLSCAISMVSLFVLALSATGPASSYAQDRSTYTCTCADASCYMTGQPENWSSRSVERGFRFANLTRTTMRYNGNDMDFYRSAKDGNGRYRQVHGSDWRCEEVTTSDRPSRLFGETQTAPRTPQRDASPRSGTSPRSEATPRSPRASVSPAEACQRNVQGRISRDYEGSKSWDASSLQRLCRGTTRPGEPGKCFQNVMFGGVDWGGGTRWAGSNALDLCAGTSDANGTVVCFRSQLSRLGNWQQAIRACDAR